MSWRDWGMFCDVFAVPDFYFVLFCDMEHLLLYCEVTVTLVQQLETFEADVEEEQGILK